MNDQQRAAMQMALEALCVIHEVGYLGGHPILSDKTQDTITALREALAQPQGEWVDLTDDELNMYYGRGEFQLFCDRAHFKDVSKTIIAKFKSKNIPPVVPQEPVAWVVYDSEANDIVWSEEGKKLKAETPLYTTSPVVPQGDDDLTIAYMVGYEKGKDEAKEKAAKVCEKEMQAWINFDEDCHEASAIKKCAAVIRSIK